MKTIHFTREQRIIHSLLLNGSFIDNIGLMHGKMGIAIYFYQLFRKTNNSIYEEYAGELIDEIYEEIHSQTSCNFENGLAGIGWGIEYLVKNGFLEADTSEVLEEFDNRIMHEITWHAPNDIGILNGIGGYILYFISRLGSNKPDSRIYQTLSKTIKETVGLLQNQINNTQEPWFTELFKEPESFDITWNYPALLWLLCDLNSAGVCFPEIDQLTHKLISPLENGSFLPKLQSHRALLALAIEKVRQEDFKFPLPIDLNEISSKLLQDIMRDNIAKELKKDSGIFQDGITGIAFIYNILFNLTKENFFRQESEYWNNLEFNLPDSGHRFNEFNNRKETQNQSLGILNGLTGINLFNYGNN